MNWVDFGCFFILSLFSIWNGKDVFNKKQWINMGLKLVLICFVTFVFALTFSFLQSYWTNMPVHMIEKSLLLISSSFLCVWMVKLLVVIACLMFGNIINFHKKYNSIAYNKIGLIVNKLSKPLLISLKCLVSLASFLMLYGIWFGSYYTAS